MVGSSWKYKGAKLKVGGAVTPPSVPTGSYRKRDLPLRSFNTRTGKGGGADSALPSCFLWISFEVFVRSPWFFQYLPKNKRRTFWCKNWRRVDFGGSIFKPPKSALSFSPSWCHDGGVLAPPPAPAGWARPVARGGGGRPGAGGGGGAGRALEGAGRALGGGRRRPVKVTDSRERRPGEPSSGGHRTVGPRASLGRI